MYVARSWSAQCSAITFDNVRKEPTLCTDNAMPCQQIFSWLDLQKALIEDRAALIGFQHG